MILQQKNQLWSPCDKVGSTIYQTDDQLLICTMFAVLYHFVNDIIFYLQILLSAHLNYASSAAT